MPPSDIRPSHWWCTPGSASPSLMSPSLQTFSLSSSSLSPCSLSQVEEQCAPLAHQLKDEATSPQSHTQTPDLGHKGGMSESGGGAPPFKSLPSLCRQSGGKAWAVLLEMRGPGSFLGSPIPRRLPQSSWAVPNCNVHGDVMDYPLVSVMIQFRGKSIE